MGDHDSGKPALSWPHQPRGAPVRYWRRAAGKTRQMPGKNVSGLYKHIVVKIPLYTAMFLFVAFIIVTCTFTMKFEDSNAEFAPFPFHSYHLMQNCWKRYSSERPHFQQIVTTLTNFLDHLNKRDSVYYDSDSDEAPDFTRQGSGKGPSRTGSFRSGIQMEGKDLGICHWKQFLLYKCIHKNSQHPPSLPSRFYEPCSLFEHEATKQPATSWQFAQTRRAQHSQQSVLSKQFRESHCKCKYGYACHVGGYAGACNHHKSFECFF